MVEDQKHLSWISAGKVEGKTQAYLELLYLEGDLLAISRNWRNFSILCPFSPLLSTPFSKYPLQESRN